MPSHTLRHSPTICTRRHSPTYGHTLTLTHRTHTHNPHRTLTHRYTHTDAHTHPVSHSHTCTRRDTPSLAPSTHTDTHTNTRQLTHMHADSHTHAHSHTQTAARPLGVEGSPGRLVSLSGLFPGSGSDPDPWAVPGTQWAPGGAGEGAGPPLVGGWAWLVQERMPIAVWRRWSRATVPVLGWGFSGPAARGATHSCCCVFGETATAEK